LGVQKKSSRVNADSEPRPRPQHLSNTALRRGAIVRAQTDPQENAGAADVPAHRLEEEEALLLRGADDRLIRGRGGRKKNPPDAKQSHRPT
jgi:hypothetical protein